MIALDRLRERTTGELAAADVALEREALSRPAPVPMLSYELPDGQLVLVTYDLCHGRDAIRYLRRGRTEIALLASTRAEVAEAAAVWGSR